MTVRGDQEAAIAAAYRIGALHHAVMTRGGDGRVSLAWPTGRGPCVVAPELLEAWVEQINELHSRLDEARKDWRAP